MGELLKQQSVKDLFDKLKAFYKRDDGKKIKEWLTYLKNKDNIIGGNVIGLLNNSKIKLDTVSPEGKYNIILLWISRNLDKFQDFDFKDVPPSYVKGLENIDLSTDLSINVRQIKKTLKTEEDVKSWFSDPETDPITGKKMSPTSIEYEQIYEQAYKIMKQNKKPINEIYDTFPKNHLLFGNINLLFYAYVSKQLPNNISSINIPKEYNNTTYAYDNICELLSDGVKNTEYKDNIFDTEFELLKNRFGMFNNSENYTKMERIITNYITGMVSKIMSSDTEYKNITINDIINYNYESEAKSILHFLGNNKMSNGVTIIEFIRNLMDDANSFWLNRLITLYDSYIKTYNDLDKLFDPESGIIENREDKIYNIIDDPLDKYFVKYENALKKIKSPKFSRLLDLNTLKKVDTKFFLDDKQFAEFKNNKKDLEKQYLESKQVYEASIKSKSKTFSPPKSKTPSPPKRKTPSPPKRPTITLGNGSVYQYGFNEPVHIKNSLLEEFDDAFLAATPFIEEYNKIKDMNYLELIKYSKEQSPTKKIKGLIKKNKLFSMNRVEITKNILYDTKELNDKCNEETDILTKEEFADENYPLAKLQLMVRLKIYNKKQYKTECIYAPALYNYLVTCVNEKKPFINPKTKSIYTQENIDDLMNVMKIVNPDIEIPKFLLHINDTQLYMDYDPITYKKKIWYKIYIYRKFGDIKFGYDVCVIPSFMEPTAIKKEDMEPEDRALADMDPADMDPEDRELAGQFVTGSTDLTSSTMKFKIFKLFNDGRLLHKYVPPYCDENGEYIKLTIHFNNYKTVDSWVFDGRKQRTKDELIKMFKHYATEINNSIY